jgi:trimethylamine--corrinoid protein Co-methyltransferase
MAQMGRFLDLPVRMPAMLRDAKVLDAQAGFETGMIGSLTALAADLMDGMQLDMDMVVDFPDLIFCNEAMAGIRRLTRDVVVSDDALAFNVIKETGPGGTFLAHTHTLEKFRQELWAPGLFERGDWDTWERSGSQDIFKVAERRVLEYLSADSDPLLPESAKTEIDMIVENQLNSR